jgi:hypothetical protein
MQRRLTSGLIAVFVALGTAAVPAIARAQSAQAEFWPELDVWKRLSPEVQLYFPLSISHSRESSFTEGTVAANLDYRFDVHMSVRGGVYYIFSISDTSSRELRPIGEFSYRWFVGAALRVTDRSRFEVRIINGVTSWRYRNRVRAERTYNLRENHTVTPYTTLEAGYDSRYDAVNRVRFNVGTEYVFSPRTMLDGYLSYQHDSRAQLTNVYALGLALNLTF